jgi:excinuclease ABC subunit A
MKEAAASFQANLKRMQTKPEDVMPWKIHGDRWHLSDKGFPPGQRLRWDRAVLPRMLDLIRQVEPKVKITWTGRVAINLHVPGVSRSWSGWNTKNPRFLDCRFLGKKGQFNLAQVEGIGVSPEISENHAAYAILRLVFQQLEQVQPERLKAILREHLKGFRETFG